MLLSAHLSRPPQFHFPSSSLYVWPVSVLFPRGWRSPLLWTEFFVPSDSLVPQARTSAAAGPALQLPAFSFSPAPVYPWEICISPRTCSGPSVWWTCHSSSRQVAVLRSAGRNTLLLLPVVRECSRPSGRCRRSSLSCLSRSPFSAVGVCLSPFCHGPSVSFAVAIRYFRARRPTKGTRCGRFHSSNPQRLSSNPHLSTGTTLEPDLYCGHTPCSCAGRNSCSPFRCRANDSSCRCNDAAARTSARATTMIPPSRNPPPRKNSPTPGAGSTSSCGHHQRCS
mmetsp:Transcript_12965/g.31598  ORF Transcript_12965/g.31598 Transcript_12965/m.31598 type:complete len:281 (-) Transcript_12965:4504-5346(-)